MATRPHRDLRPSAHGREHDAAPLQPAAESPVGGSGGGGLGGVHRARVLVVHDALQHPLADALARAGYDVVTVRSGEAAMTMLDREPMDLVLLDTELPGMSGFETCRRIRHFSDVPILFASTGDSLEARVMGFDSGADDFVALPAESLEVDRRARALLRRMRMNRAVRQVAGPAGISLDVRAHRAFVADRQLDLTPKEFSILQLLLERQGEVLSSDEISSEIWGYETFGSRNFVEAHISRLRGKLQRAGADEVVETVRGVGYVIRPQLAQF